MADEEYGTTQAQDAGYDGGNDLVELSDSDVIKLELLKGLIAKNVNLSDLELSELTGFQTDKIRKMRITTSNKDEKINSFDYVLAFDVGDDAKEGKKVVKPKRRDLKAKKEDDEDPEWESGMTQAKYYGQIFNNFWQRLEAANLSVEAYKSAEKECEPEGGDGESDEKEAQKKSDTMFLIVGISETNLKSWADARDTDLLIDAKGGVEVGREKDFALAKRTILLSEQSAERKDNGGDSDSEDETIDLSNWAHLYGEYSKTADERVYKHYNRLPPGVDDSFQTVFDERTRLRIIYECIVADTNEGGAEISIADDLLNKKHPLKAVFPLHNQMELDYFSAEWISNWSPKVWMWCPLSRVRDYFGEPVAFYFAFLMFYLKWLIAPAIVGVIFFAWQMAVSEVAVPGIPFLCFFMIFWSVAFVDFWARAESRYRLQWGMTKFSDKAVARPQFKGEWQHDSVTGLWVEDFSIFRRGCRAGSIYAFVMLWLSICVISVVVVLVQRDKDPNNLTLKVALGVANAVMIFVFDAIYKVVSRFGNEWENHRTEQDFENAMIYKSFCFKFVNSFASLFYLGFVRPTSTGLYYYVHFYTTVCGSAAPYMRQFLTLHDPGNAAYAWFQDSDNIDTTSDNYELCMDDTDDASDQACILLISDEDNDNAAWAIAVDGFYPVDDEVCPSGGAKNGGSRSEGVGGALFDGDGKCYGTCDETETRIEMNEAVLGELRIQLLTLFVTAIVIQNTLEVGIPLICQRIRDKKAEKEETKKSIAQFESEKDRYESTIEDMSELIIQFGYVTLFVIAFPLTPLLAIVNNVIEMKVDATNLVKTSQRPDPNGSFGLGSWNGVLGFFGIIAVGTNVLLITFRTKLVTILIGDDTASQWIFFSLLAILLSIIVGIEKWIIPDVPMEVEQAIERQRLVESVLILGAGAFEVDKKPDLDDDDDAIPFDPSLEFIDVKTLPDIPYQINNYDSANTQTA